MYRRSYSLWSPVTGGNQEDVMSAENVGRCTAKAEERVYGMERLER